MLFRENVDEERDEIENVLSEYGTAVMVLVEEKHKALPVDNEEDAATVQGVERVVLVKMSSVEEAASVKTAFHESKY